MTIQVIPTVIPKRFEEIELYASQVRKLVKRMQIDVTDGAFTPNTTWPYNGKDTEIFEKLVYEKEGLPFWKKLDYEIDMMVLEPEKSALDWVQAGARALIIHHGSTEKMSAIRDTLKEMDVEFAIAFRPSTSDDEIVRNIEEYHPDFVQTMGNDRIGLHGVKLDELVYDKIKMLRKKYPKLSIGVDIGVNKDTAPKLVEAGATRLAAGSAIFDGGDIKETIHCFQNLK